MNHLCYHAIFYSGTKYAPVVFKFTTFASHLYGDITICSDTLCCTPSSPPLVICGLGLSSFSHISLHLFPLFSPHPSPHLIPHQHPSLKWLITIQACFKMQTSHLPVSRLHLSHLVFTHLFSSHTPLLIYPFLSPPTLSFHHISLNHLLFFSLTSIVLISLSFCFPSFGSNLFIYFAFLRNAVHSPSFLSSFLQTKSMTPPSCLPLTQWCPSMSHTSSHPRHDWAWHKKKKPNTAPRLPHITHTHWDTHRHIHADTHTHHTSPIH